MKRIVVLFASLLLTASFYSCKKSSVVQVWSLSDSFSTPESVYYDSAEDVLYVANIGGEGGKKDGDGWISKVSPDGKMIQPKWATGLHAPTGMFLQNGILWTADVDAVVAVDQKTGMLVIRIPLEGAIFANDVAMSPDGTVYISDTIGGRIYQVKEGTPSVFMEGAMLEGPNGLMYRDGKLYVVAWGKDTKPDWSTSAPGKLYVIDVATKQITPISNNRIGALDGLEVDGKGNFITSDWKAGKLFMVAPSGEVKEIFSGKQGFANIVFVPKSNLVVIPEMKENKVTAVRLP